MTKRTDKRWEILSKFFAKLKALSEDESVILVYDGGHMSKCVFDFDEETRYAYFKGSTCTWAVYDEREHFDNESAKVLMGRMRGRITACREIKF